MKKLAVSILVLLGCVAFTAALAQQMPQVNPKAELLKSIERGKVLFSDAKLGTTGQSCNDCHIEGGTKDGQMGRMAIKAFNNVAATYPKYFMMASKVITLDQMVNWCITTPMKGTALPWDDQRLADLVAYTASVKTAAKAPEKGK
jgi:thiosulfate dehydrogenase